MIPADNQQERKGVNMNLLDRESRPDILQTVDRQRLEQLVMMLAKTITSELSEEIDAQRNLANTYISMGKSHNAFMARSEALETQALLDRLSQPYRKLLGVGPDELISPNIKKAAKKRKE